MSLAEKLLRYRRVGRRMEQALARVEPGLTPALAEVIVLLAEAPMTTGELAARADAPHAAIRWHTRILLQRGWVRYADGEQAAPGRPRRERLSKRLILTAAGQRIANLLMADE